MPEPTRDESASNRSASTNGGARGGLPIAADRPCTSCGYNLFGLRTGQSCPECGRPIALPSTSDASIGGLPIAADRPCASCGYNLVGLRIGQSCPECGLPIALPSARDALDDNLVRAPMGYLRLLMLGLGMMGAVSIGVLALALFASSTFGAASLQSAWPTMLGRLNAQGVGTIAAGAPWFFLIAPWAGLAFALLWIGGLVILTLPRPKFAFSNADDARDPWLRLGYIVLGLEAWWLPAALAYFWLVRHASVGAPGAPGGLVEKVVGVGFYVAFAIAGLGMLPLALHLSRFADWASDTKLADRFRYSVGGIVLFGGLIVLGRALPMIAGGAILRGFELCIAFGWAASVFMLLWSVVSLAMMCSHALVNARQTVERDRRLVEKMRDEAERHRQTLDNMPEIPAPDLVRRVGTPRRE